VFERLGKPSIVVVTAEFESFARQLATRLERPSHRVLVLPYPLEGRPTEEVSDIAERSYPDLLRALGAGV
jgi:hypothetical protein